MEEKERQARISRKKLRLHPREKANFLSHWFFCWQLPFFYKGYRKHITEQDLYGSLQDHQSKTLGDKLEIAWSQEMKTDSNPSLWRAMFKIFGSEFIMYGLILIPLELVIRMCQPLLIGKLMNYYTSNQTASKAEAYVYASAIVLASFLYVVIGHSYSLGLLHLGMKIRIAVASLIYRKSLKLNRNVLSVGHVVNLLSNDVSRFDFCVANLHFLWMAPLESLIILGLVYWILDATALIGIGILLTCIPVQIYLANKISKYRMTTALKTDLRVRLMNEILSGIKIIKMYTWEKPFSILVEKTRKLEMQQIKTNSYLRGINKACQIFLGRVAIYFCILVYVLVGGTLQPEYVYVLTSFHEIIRLSSVIFLPIGMMQFGETLTSVRRIRTFLTQPEVSIRTDSPQEGIRLKQISTKLDTTENILNDVTFEAKPGQLVSVIGPVGSGKSTLLETILRENPITEGSVEVGGTISYAPQQPWLFEGSIRDNILFGEKFDQTKYKHVVKVCCLEHDCSLLAFGDRTLVGERGVMLSGGQKSRINLARAIYKDADLYLLDDPLSAVDVRVGKQLFEDCVRDYLKCKTRVLVTHQLQHLRSADVIYLIEDGKVTGSGNYRQLVDCDNEFLKLLGSKENQETEEERDQKTNDDDTLEASGEMKEHHHTGVVSGKIYRDFFKLGGVASSVILPIAIVQGVAVGSDYFLSFWVNLEEENNNNTLTTWQCLYIYTSFIVFLIIITVISTIGFARFCIATSVNIHNSMLKKILSSSMRFFNTNPSGRILNRFSKDLGSIDEYLPLNLMDTVQIFFNVIAIIVVISFINWWILIPSTIMFVLFYFFRHVFLASSRNLKRLEAKTRSPVYCHVAASMEGVTTIRAFKTQNNLRNEFDNHQDVHSSCFYMFVACDGAFGFWLDFVCVVFMGIVIFGFLLMDSEQYGASVGLSITQLIMMTGLLQWGMKQSGELENQMISVERVMEYTKLRPEMDDGSRQVPRDWPSNGTIDFENVSLRYSVEDSPVLKEVTFHINPMEKIGIVGRTGAGKSSLISACFRFFEIQGQILVDGIDIKTIPLDTLRSAISIIPQEPFLFSGTIRSNLDPFDQYQDAQLWDALEEVELKAVVSDLSSKVSEGGFNFSVGQRQLFCLARAIVRMSKMLILDEATASVDPLTDELIQKTIRRKFQECTLLIVAHRVHTVLDCDRILVMDDGKVVEFDEPLKLLRDTDGIFYSLYNNAFKINKNH